MNDGAIRVLVADDSAGARRAIGQLIEAQSDMELVHVASTAHEVARRAAELQPDIVLMDVHMPDMDGLEAIWLVANKIPHGAVIMVTSEESIEFLQRAMTSGAQGYVLKPLGDGGELLRAIRELHRRSTRSRIAPPEPGGGLQQSRIGRRIAVIGAKGGSGKTTLGVGLALTLRQQTQSSVILFEADFLFGDAAIHLNLPTNRSVLDLLPYAEALDSRLVDGVVAKHPSGIHLLARPPRPEQADAITASHVTAILSVLSRTYDYVVIDTQPSYDERMLALLEQADVYVLVLVTDLGAVRNARQFLDVARVLGLPEDRVCTVLNRANSLAGLSLDDIASVLGTPHIIRLPSAGAAISEAINSGRPLVLDQPKAAFSRAVGELAERVRAISSATEVKLR